VPFIGPDWAALGDWAKDAMLAVPCAEIACTDHNVNVVGGIAGRLEFVEGLQSLYSKPLERSLLIDAGLQLVEQFDWEHIGKAFLVELNSALELNAAPPVLSESLIA
jgi:hypothetical protein